MTAAGGVQDAETLTNRREKRGAAFICALSPRGLDGGSFVASSRQREHLEAESLSEDRRGPRDDIPGRGHVMA